MSPHILFCPAWRRLVPATPALRSLFIKVSALCNAATGKRSLRENAKRSSSPDEQEKETRKQEQTDESEKRNKERHAKDIGVGVNFKMY